MLLCTEPYVFKLLKLVEILSLLQHTYSKFIINYKYIV